MEEAAAEPFGGGRRQSRKRAEGLCGHSWHCRRPVHGSVKEAAAEVQSLSGGTKGLCGHSWHCRRPVALWRKLQQSLSGGQAAVSETCRRTVRPQLAL